MKKVKDISIGHVINQSEYELVGGLWTDRDGKIHYVGLIRHEESGVVMPDFPRMEDVYISDVAQV